MRDTKAVCLPPSSLLPERCFRFRLTATAGNPEVQIAQSSSRAVVARSNVATGSANNVLRSDESYGTLGCPADGRTRG